MFNIKKFLTENKVTLNEVRPESWNELKIDLANSLKNEQNHYKAFLKASKLSTAQMRMSLRKMLVAQRQSVGIAVRLENVLAAFERQKND